MVWPGIAVVASGNFGSELCGSGCRGVLDGVAVDRRRALTICSDMEFRPALVWAVVEAAGEPASR